MQKTLKSAEYARLVATLVAVRHGSGIRQQALARNLAGRSLLLPNTKAASAATNITQIPAEQIRDARVTLTAVGGRVVFEGKAN